MARHNKRHVFTCLLLCVISARTPTVRPSYDGQSLTGKDIVANAVCEDASLMAFYFFILLSAPSIR